MQIDLPGRDKTLHGLMYLVLAIAWLLSIPKMSNVKSPIAPYIFVCALVTLYGALLELLQHYCTHTRSGDLMDILADFLGAILGVALVALYKSLRHYHLSK